MAATTQAALCCVTAGGAPGLRDGATSFGTRGKIFRKDLGSQSASATSRNDCTSGRTSSSSQIRHLPFHGRFERAASASAAAAGAVETSDAPLSDRLQGITILRSDGSPVPLLSLWADRRAVVAWVRHYGCLLCRKRAATLAAKKAELEAAGVALAVIGPASVDQAATFLEQTKFPGEVYADPDHKSFEALQFASGVGTVLNPKAGLNLMQARMQGFAQDWGLSLREDTINRGGWQQGGILVAGPGEDTVLFLFKDEAAGDEPDMDDVMRACCEAKVLP